MKFYLLLICSTIFVTTKAQLSTISTQSLLITQPHIVQLEDGSFLQLKTKNLGISGRTLLIYQQAITLQRFDKNNLLEKENKMDPSKYRACSFLTTLVKSGDSYWVLYLEAAESREVGNFKAVKINPATLEGGEPKLIATQGDVNEKIGMFTGGRSLRMYSKSSPNSKFHFLLVDTGKDEFYLSCLNEQMESVWKTKLEIPDLKLEELNSYAIDNKGQIYLAFQKDEKAFLSSFDIRGKATHKELAFTEGPIDVQVFATKKSEEVLLIGFYGSNYHARGVYKGRLDTKTLEVKDVTQSAFPDSLIQRLKKDGLAGVKAKKYGIWKFQYDSEILEQEDGNIKIVTEVNAELGSGNITANAVGSLLVTHLQNKAPAFFSHIPRYAVTRGRNPHEYFALPGREQLFLFYWDDVSNLSRSLSEDQKVLRGSNAALVGASIRNDGTINRRSVAGGDSAEEALSFYKENLEK